MYQIALCDDEVAELNRVENMFEDYCKKNTKPGFVVRRFADADELLRVTQEKEYMPDILFMDIYMPGRFGIDVARELHKMGNRCHIIFITASTEYALDAFRVNADQYLVKPVLEEELFQVLDNILDYMDREHKKYLPLRIDNSIHRIALHEIIFCEAQKKYQCIYLEDGTKHLLRMTMAKIYDMLSVYPEFAKAGISYIVNLEHVDSINTHELLLDNGEKIYLPRGSYQPLREKYFRYYCEEE